jgi:hypothetical protein
MIATFTVYKIHEGGRSISLRFQNGLTTYIFLPYRYITIKNGMALELDKVYEVLNVKLLKLLNDDYDYPMNLWDLNDHPDSFDPLFREAVESIVPPGCLGNKCVIQQLVVREVH